QYQRNVLANQRQNPHAEAQESHIHSTVGSDGPKVKISHLLDNLESSRNPSLGYTDARHLLQRNVVNPLYMHNSCWRLGWLACRQKLFLPDVETHMDICS